MDDIRGRQALCFTSELHGCTPAQGQCSWPAPGSERAQYSLVARGHPALGWWETRGLCILLLPTWNTYPLFGMTVSSCPFDKELTSSCSGTLVRAVLLSEQKPRRWNKGRRTAAISSLCFSPKQLQLQAVLGSNIFYSLLLFRGWTMLMNLFHWNKVKEISFDTKSTLLSTFLLPQASFSSPCQDTEHSGQKWKSWWKYIFL